VGRFPFQFPEQFIPENAEILAGINAVDFGMENKSVVRIKPQPPSLAPSINVGPGALLNLEFTKGMALVSD
jgi:hypothetical protein